MKDFLPLVKERPDPTLKINEFKCPYCDSKNVKNNGSSSTMVGGREEDDVNHVWTSLHCQDCGKECTHEHHSNNTWYTDKDKRIIKGIPSCFEAYIYTCAECGGDVHRHTVNKISGENVYYVITDADGESNCKTIFKCKKCNKEIESDIEYYGCYYLSPEERKFRKENPVKIQFNVKEEIGACFVNTNGLKKSFVGID